MLFALPGLAQTVSFQLGSSSAAESVATQYVVVQLSTGAPLGAQLTVDVTDAGTGNALSGTDYSAPGTITLTFAAGSADLSTQVAAINITQDTIVEGDETLDLLLSNATGGSLGSRTEHELTIADDETAVVNFNAASSTTAAEDLAGTHTVVVDLTITGGATLADDVIVNIADLFSGTATSGGDYTALGIPLQLTFTAGSSTGATQTFVIPITVDAAVEGDETIDINIFNVTGPASIGATADHEVSIFDDDGAFVSFRGTSSPVAETAGATNVIVELSIPAGPTPTTAPFTVDVVDLFTGSATFGIDYAAGFLVSLTFPAGSVDGATQVVPVTITDDSSGETYETINYLLFNLIGGGGIGVVLGEPVNQTVTIVDDEVTTVGFQSSSSSHSESGGTFELIVELDVDSGGTAQDAITVNVSDFLNGTATSATDYGALAIPEVVTFPGGSADGATDVVSITIIDDGDTELIEYLNLSITSVSGSSAVAGTSNFQLAILDDDGSAAVEFQSVTSNVTEAATTHEVVVVLNTVTPLASDVTVDVTDGLSGTATSAVDYNALAIPVQLTFSSGAANGATQVVSITILDDADPEDGETIKLSLSNPSGALTLDPDTAHTATIANDDIPSLSFAAASSSVGEAAVTEDIVVTLTFAGGGTLATDVTVDVTDQLTGSATSATDYNALATVTLTFAAGAISGATELAPVSILDDSLIEGDETVDLRLSNPSGAAAVLGATTDHELTITDDDVGVVLFANSASSSAENTGTHQVAVTLVTTNTLDIALTVDVTDLLTGTASSATDYTVLAAPVQLTFPIGATNGNVQLLNITYIDDALAESAETIDLRLSNATSPLILGNSTNHTATITDDDTVTLTFQAATSSPAEAGGTHNVIVTLNAAGGGSTTADVTVDVTDLLTGTATSATDYTALASPVSLTFSAGASDGDTEVVQIPVLLDAITEGNENVNLRLSNPSGLTATLGGTTNHVVTIVDDIPQVFFQTNTSSSVDESTAFNVIIEISTSAPLGGDVTVDITDQLTGTAASATDYTAIGTLTVTFAAGSVDGDTEVVTITPIDDLSQEGDETIYLVLENVTNGVFGNTTQHEATLNEDECVCAGGDLSFRRFDPIAIDGDMSDWGGVLDDPDNNVCDGALGTIPPLPDRDSAGSGGRDLVHFAFTWDLTSIYFFTRRAASANPNTNFVYYVDENNNSLMESGETVVRVIWSGASSTVTVDIYDYVPSVGGGDVMADGSGFADGYTMPGSMTLVAAGPTGYANPAGDAMEFSFTWASIGVLPQRAFNFHVTVDNSFPPAPGGGVDNAGGCGGGLGSTQFPASRLEPDDSIEYDPSDTIYLAKQVYNDGNDVDTINLTWSSVGSHTPTSVTFYDDADSSGDFSVGDTVLTDTDGDLNPDTGPLDLFTGTDILVEYVIDGAASGTAVVTLIASSSFSPPSTETAEDTLFPKPSVRFKSASSATIESGTHNVVLALDFPAGGTLTTDAVITLSDLGTGSALTGTDYGSVPTTVTFPTGSGPGATQHLSIPITADANVEGDETIDLRITATAGPANIGTTSNHSATITDNDTATIAFQSAASATTDESTATHDLVLVVNTPPGGAIHVPITIDITDAFSGTANSATDYSAIGTTTVTFPAFSADGSTQTGGPQILQDLLIEGDETLTLLLNNPGSLASLGATTTHVATITDDDNAAVLFGSSTSTVTEPNSGDIVVTIDTGGATLAVELTVDIVDLLTGSAPSATDYTAFPTTTLTFAIGATDGSTEVGTLATIDDALVEIDETVDFRLQNPGGVLTLGSTTNHTATIVDDESATVAFQSTTSSVVEDPTTEFVIVTLTATGTLQDELTVNVSDLGTGTALTATDYTDFGSPLTLTFAAGSPTGSTQVVAVPILDDTLIEATETVDLRLATPSSPVTLGANTNHTLSITDDEAATVTFALAASNAPEATTPHSIVVTLSGTPGAALGSDATVDIADLLTGTATSATDYTFASPTTLTFSAGDADGDTQVLNIPITSDLLVEGDETANLQLQNASGSGLTLGSTTNHTATIVDDEFASVAFAAASSTVNEANVTHNVSVQLTVTGGASLASDATFDITDLLTGTAASASDYNVLASPIGITFAAGSTNGVADSIPITILDDLLAEGNETIQLQLSNPSAVITLGASSNHAASIIDDDSPTVNFQATTSASGVESGTHNVVLVLTVPNAATLGSDATVDVIDLLSGTANSATDYTAIGTTTVTFPAGSADGTTAVLPITITPDTILEGDETIDLDLANPVGAGMNLGGTTSHVATITDDETANFAFVTAADSASEAVGTHNVLVQLNVSGGGSIAAGASVEVADLLTGTANSATDYNAIASPVTLNFAAGSNDGDTQPLPITFVNDTLIELAETIDLRLQNPSSPITLGATTNHTSSIIDNEAATLALAAATSAVGESAGANTIIITLTTTVGTTLQDAVTVSVNDLLTGTANSATDYTFASPVVLNFPASSGNGTTGTITITNLPDLLVEGDETINLDLSGITGAATLGAQSTHVATITDDEFADIVFQVATSSVVEAVTTHQVLFTLNVTPGTSLGSNVSVTLDDLGSSTAASASDYANFGPISLTFAAGTTNGATNQYTLSILDDLLAEGTEFIDLALSAPTAGLDLGATTFQQVSILDPETPEVDILSATSASGVESGTHNVILFITVAGGGALGNSATVELADFGTGTALSGTDYTALAPVTVILPAGSANGSTHLAPIAIISDNILEGDETIDLRIQNPSGAGLILGSVRTIHTATITDDETANFSFSAASSSVAEAITTHNLVVQINISGGGTILTQSTVDFSDTLGGSASSGIDYSAVAPVTLTFPAGSNDGDFQIIPMPILDDTLVEGNETALFQLANASAPVTLGTSLHTATITDGETGSVALQSGSSSIAESATPANIVVVLTTTGGGTLASNETVNLTDLLSGTANSATDYSFASPSVVTFLAGDGNGKTRVASVTILDNLIAELDETVALNLNTPTSPLTLGGTVNHTLTIVDDEDADISFQSATSTVTEANTSHVVVLQLNVANGGNVPAGFSVTLTDLGTGSATIGTDYSSIGGPIVFNFPAGATDGDTQVQSVPILDDAVPETNDTINLQLSNSTSPVVELGTTNHVVTIQDDDFQGIITFQVDSSLTASEATGTHYVVLELSAIGSAPVDLVVDVVDAGTGLATSGVDYVALGAPAQVTFPAGSVNGDTQAFPVSIIDDPTTEGFETIDLQLSAVAGPGTLGSTTEHTITINDDDGPFIDFKGTTSSTTEVSVVAFATVQLIVPAGGPIGCTAMVQVNDVGSGSATSGSDYSFGGSTLTFGPASTSGTTQLVPITILNDNLVESPETIELRLTNLTPACVPIGAPTNHEVTITDDETPADVNFQLLPTSVVEDPVTHFVGVVLTMGGGNFLGSVVSVNITDLLTGSATSGIDYTALAVPTSVSFPIGTPSGRILFTPIDIIEDALGEPNETINLRLGTISGPGVHGLNTEHTATIIDEDVNLTFAVASSTVGESAVTHKVVVTLNANAALTVDATVDVSDVGGTATSGSDYAAFATTTLTYPAGTVSATTQIVNVVIQDDTYVEPTETVTLRLSNVTGEPTLAGFTNHTVSITDSESASVAFALASSSLVEDPTNHSVTVTLTSTGTLASGITVSINDLLSGTATSATDYTALAVPVLANFAAGAANGATVTITVPVLEDTDIESDETINLRITGASSPVTISGISNHTVTITDEDAPSVAFQSGASSSVEANVTHQSVIVVLTSPNGPLPSTLTVDISDQGTGSAASASDYNAFALTTLTFSAGVANGSTQVLNITILDDLSAEPAETIDLALSNVSGGPSGYLGSTSAHSVTITDNDAVATSKSLLTTDQAHTTGSNVTIGEIVTYQAILTFYETGGLANLQLQDTLPADLSYQAGTVTVTPGNAGMSIATTTTTWVAPLLQVDFTGVNNPSNGNALDDFITVTYQAIVANTANNNHGDTKTNSLVFTDFNTNDSDSVNLSVVEPQITVAKTASNVARCNGTATEPIAGDVLEYTLTVAETQGLDAFDISISDVLSEGLAYDVSFTPTVSGAGNTIAAPNTVGTGLPGDPQTLTWSLALGNADIDVGASSAITIVYRVTVLATVGGGQTLDNTATLGFSSIDGASANERIQGSAPGADDYESADTYTLTSRVSGSSFAIPASRRRSPTFIDAAGNITGPGGPAVLTATDTLVLADGSGVTITGDGISGPPPVGAPDITVSAGATATINTDGTNTFQYGIVTISAGATLTLTGDLAITFEQIVMAAGSTLTLPSGSALTVTGPCELNGGIGTANYVTIQATAPGGYTIDFQCSFVGDHVRFEDLGAGKVTFNGATTLDFAIFVDGSGGTPYVCYCDTANVTWTNLAFGYGDGTATTIETCPGSGDVIVDGYASTIANVWIGGDPTDVENGGTVTWLNPTPVRRLAGSLTAHVDGGVQVKFATENEIGVATLDIQRSTGDDRWTTVSTLLPQAAEFANGDYSHYDPAPAGSYQYRVQVNDINSSRRWHGLGDVVVEKGGRVKAEGGSREASTEVTYLSPPGIVVTPTYSAGKHASETPVQTGTAQRAAVYATGLYHAPQGTLYNLGRELPRLPGDLVFVRGLSDFYTDTNTVWVGDLSVTGQAGLAPDPDPDGYLTPRGYIARFRAETDAIFSLNPLQAPGPNWYFPDRLAADATLEFNIDLRNPRAGMAIANIAIRSSTPGDQDLILSIGGQAIGRANWSGEGHRRITFVFPTQVLSDGSNPVTLSSTTAASSARLDYLEILTPASPILGANGLLVRIVEPGPLTVPRANYATNVTTHGAEAEMALDADFPAGALVHFAGSPASLDWKPAATLNAADLSQVDYIAVAPAEFLDVLTPLLQQHESRGLRTAAFAYEDIIDSYGAGIFGPASIISLADSSSARYLLLGAGTTYDYKNREGRDTPSGIPTGWTHVYHGLAATDDIYSGGHACSVGRLPARSRGELSIMVDKILDYQPSRRAVLLADRDDSEGGVDRFAHMQASLADSLPTALITTTGRNSTNVTAELVAAIQAGSRIVAYQGHAGFNEIGDRFVHVNELAQLPTSAWILSTCLTGSYYINSETPTLARSLLNEPGAGGAMVIASTRFGHADDEHTIVRKALEGLARGGTTWGDILRSLKATLPGETMEVFQLFGDPAMSAADHSAPRTIALRTPQGGTLIGGSGPLPISFDLIGDGWWDETFRISYSPALSTQWTPIQDYSIARGQRSHTLYWTPPTDGHYRIRIEVIDE